MRKNINNLYVLILIFLIQFKSNTQTIHIGATSIWTLTNQKVKMVNSTDDFSSQGIVELYGYEHHLKNKKVSIFVSYFKYRGFTNIKFKEGSVLGPRGAGFLVGTGFDGVKVNRYDISISYNICNPLKKLYLKPFVSIALQTTKKNDKEIGDFFRPNGPDYYQTDFMNAESFNTYQFVPSIGIKTGIVLWKRIDVGYQILATYGFKTYQNMYFKYNYRGIPQETAIFQGKGTGMFFSLNIGYRIFKLK